MAWIRTTACASSACLCTRAFGAILFLTVSRNRRSLIHVLLVVQDETDDWGWGVVLNYQKKTVPEATAAPDEEAAGARFVVDVLLWCALEDSAAAAGGEKRPVPGTTDKGEMRAVPVLLPSIDGISSVRIYVPKVRFAITNSAMVLRAASAAI